MTDELSPFVYKYLTLCLQQCLAWAEGGCQASLQEVAMTFPSWPHAVPFDVNALAVVLGKFSCGLSEADGQGRLRIFLRRYSRDVYVHLPWRSLLNAVLFFCLQSAQAVMPPLITWCISRRRRINRSGQCQQGGSVSCASKRPPVPHKQFRFAGGKSACAPFTL